MALAAGNATLKCRNSSLFQHFCAGRLGAKLRRTQIWASIIFSGFSKFGCDWQLLVTSGTVIAAIRDELLESCFVEVAQNQSLLPSLCTRVSVLSASSRSVTDETMVSYYWGWWCHVWSFMVGNVWNKVTEAAWILFSTYGIYCVVTIVTELCGYLSSN